MAEENTEAEGAEEGKKGGKLKLILIIVGAIVIAAGGAVGGMMFLGGSDEPAEQVEAAPEKPKQAQYTKIRILSGDPYFTVTIDSNDGKTHYLQVYVEAKSRDDEVVAALTKHMPRIVNRLTRLFSSQSLKNLRTLQGKLDLQDQATKEIQAEMQEKIGKPGIERVLFTGFVMQ